MPSFDAIPIERVNPLAKPQELLPETPVVVINRGVEALTRKFDGFNWTLRPHPEGLLEIPYGAALHFQKHSTVPGTRYPDSGAEQSYIGIVRNATTGEPIDPPAYCEPFTPEACAGFGQQIEAIAREAGEVETVLVASTITAGRVPVGRQSAGGRRRLHRDGAGNITDAMRPPAGPNDAQREQDADAAAYAAEADA